MLTQSSWTRLLAFALVLPLAACAGDDASETDSDSDAMEDMAPAPTTGSAMGAAPMMITLAAKNNSGVTGEATARHQGDSVTVEVRLSGATADGNYPGHIHSGTCEATGGVLVPLTPITVSGGTGSGTATVAASQVSEGTDAVVQYHSPTGQPVVCGSMSGHGG